MKYFRIFKTATISTWTKSETTVKLYSFRLLLLIRLKTVGVAREAYGLTTLVLLF